MFLLYKISIFIHILSAMFWIGGMLFTALVLVPITRNELLSSKRGAFFALMGRKFSNISWILFVILIITGYIQLAHRGFTIDILTTFKFWDSHFGSILAYKLISFCLILIISALHDFWLGPKAASLIDTMPQSTITKQYRKITSWVGRITLILALFVLYYAISLVRG